MLNGGSYRPAESALNATFGTGGGQIQATSGGKAGFSAYGGDLSVTVGDDETAAWSPTTYFNPSTLILNDTYGTGTLTMQNPFSFDTSSLTQINVGAGTAKFERGVTVTGTATLGKQGSGALEFGGNVSSEPGLVVGGGSVAFNGGTEETPATISIGGLEAANATSVVFNNANITDTATGTALTTLGTARLELHDSSLVTSGAVYLGRGNDTAKSATDIDNSKISCGTVYVANPTSGNEANVTADVTLENGSELSCNSFCFLKGAFKQNDNSKVTVSGEFRLGRQDKTNGYYIAPNYYLYGGVLDVGGSCVIGYAQQNKTTAACTANLYIYGGEAIMRGAVTTPTSQCDVGNIYVRGGSLTMTKSGTAMVIGTANGSGRLEVSDGGTVSVNGGITAPANSGDKTRTAVVSVLTNGTLTARSVTSVAHTSVCTSTLTLDGGKVVAGTGASSDDNSKFITGFDNAYIGAGGVEIDTNGRSPTIPQSFAARANQAWPLDGVENPGLEALLEAPGLTKTGTGTLTLSGENTYKCATRVLAGTLKVSGEGSLPATTTLRLAAGTVVDLGGGEYTIANLVGSGTVQNGTLTVTGTVWPGGGDNGTLAFASGATLKASKIAYEFDDAGETGTLEVAGALDLDGVEFAVANAEARTKKSYTIVKAGSISGTPTGGPSGTDAVTVAGGTVRVGMAGFSVIIR